MAFAGLVWNRISLKQIVVFMKAALDPPQLTQSAEH